MNLQVEIDSKKLDKALRIASTELRAEVADTIDHISRTFFKNLYQKRFKGPPGLRMGGRGNLFSRFRKRMIGAGEKEGSFKSRTSAGIITAALGASAASTEDMGMEIYTKSKVAKMHETGGAISGNMVVPFPGKYVPRKGGKILFQELIPIKIGGRLFFARENSRAKKTDIVAVFKNQINLKPRLGFYTTWQDMTNQSIARFNDAISRALKKV